MNRYLRGALIAAPLLAVSQLVPTAGARADIVLSQLIVELSPGRHAREDIEVWNNSSDRAYVATEPSEVIDAGKPTEHRLREADPAKLGLLVSPARMILEPGQRKIVRVAFIAPAADRERVYRVTVKPVAGQLSSDRSGLKILVGYDALVIARPLQRKSNVVATRNGEELRFTNAGNVSVELVGGQQCDAGGKNCTNLPAKRLYAGAEWTQKLKLAAAADYSIKIADESVRKHFPATASAISVAWNPAPEPGKSQLP